MKRRMKCLSSALLTYESLPIPSFEVVDRPAGSASWPSSHWGIVIEYIHAPTVRQFLLDEPKDCERFQLIDSIRRAIRTLHSNSIYHCDISDSNILYDEAQEACWLIDLDCMIEASCPKALAAAAGIECGTPPYANHGRKGTPASFDNYAVKVLIDQILAPLDKPA